MLLKATEDYNIDLTRSWMIGDGENDIKAGKAAGSWLSWTFFAISNSVLRRSFSAVICSIRAV